MIEIKRTEDKSEAAAFLRARGNQTDISDAIVMVAKEKNQILAVGALFLKDYNVFLDLLVPAANEEKNGSLILGVMKSLLNLADLQGIKTVYGSNPSLFDFYSILGFQKETETVYQLDLEGYFTCTHCETK